MTTTIGSGTTVGSDASCDGKGVAATVVAGVVVSAKTVLPRLSGSVGRGRGVVLLRGVNVNSRVETGVGAGVGVRVGDRVGAGVGAGVRLRPEVGDGVGDGVGITPAQAFGPRWEPAPHGGAGVGITVVSVGSVTVGTGAAPSTKAVERAGSVG